MDDDEMLIPNEKHERWIERSVLRAVKKAQNKRAWAERTAWMVAWLVEHRTAGKQEHSLRGRSRMRKSVMDGRWTEIAWHPEGFILSGNRGLKTPWIAMRLTHPMWADRPKRDRYVWWNWNTVLKLICTASRSPVTQRFAQ